MVVVAVSGVSADLKATPSKGGEMSSAHILIAASILAAAIAYAGNQLKGDTVAISQSHLFTDTKQSFAVFQAHGGSIRFCEGAEVGYSPTVVCSKWQ
jgi:hypothetical protein